MVDNSRTVRVFISSTFRDMHAERDHLVRIVFPELEQRCMERGVQFVAVDLRWGVTQQEAENGEALNICLDEIERCRPFFVCLLGERYGWRPLPPEVEEGQADQLPAEARAAFDQAYHQDLGLFRLEPDAVREAAWGDCHDEQHGALLDALEQVGVPGVGHSITAQEIHRGVLDDPAQMDHSFFYMRDPELTAALGQDDPEAYYEPTEEGRGKLAALKEAICSTGLLRRDYPEIETLGAQVLDDLWQAIDARFPEDEDRITDPLIQERRAHQLFSDRLTKFFIGREEELQALDRLVAEGSGWVAVTGESGSGKTALLAKWLECRRAGDALVIPHFVGASSRSASARDTLDRLCQELSEAAQWTEEVPGDFDALRDVFPKILQAAASRGPVLMVIDALDQLEPTDNAHSLRWLPGELPEGVTIVASSLSRDEDETWLPLQARAGKRVLRVPAMGSAETRQVIADYLAQHRKRLDDRQLALLLDKRQIDSPLYLQVALQELRMFGEYERVTDFVESLPDTIPDLYGFVLDHLEREHGEPFVRRVLSCLWCGRYGMTEPELLALGETEGEGVTPLRWARLHRILQAHLIQRGGTLGFYHRQLRDAAQRRYLHSEEVRRQTHEAIAEYFEAQPLSDPRKLEEQPWQQTHAERWDQLAATLTDLLFIEAKCEAGLTFDLVTDYNAAMAPDNQEPALRQSIEPFAQFVRRDAHLFACGDEWVVQRAYNSADAGVLPLAAERGLQDAIQKSRPWLRRLNRPPATSSAFAQVLEGHDNAVNAIAVTPDGKRAITGGGRVLLSADSDTAIRIWDLETGATVMTLSGHARAVNSIATTSDGKQVLSGSDDGSVRVWDPASGETLRTIENGAPVAALAVTPDGQYVVTGDVRSVGIWDLASGACVRTIRGHTDAITAVVTGPDGEWAATTSRDATIRIWDLASGECVRCLQGHTAPVLALAVTGDGRFLVSGSGDRTARIWDRKRGLCIRVLEGHTNNVTALALTPDGQKVITGGYKVRVWDRETGTCLRTLKGHNGRILAAAVTPDGHHALTGADGLPDSTVRVWDLEADDDQESPSTPSATHTHGVTTLALTADGSRVVTGGAEGSLRVWDTSTGECLHTLEGHTSLVKSVALTPNGLQAVSTQFARGSSLLVWDLTSGQCVRSLDGHTDTVLVVVVTPDGRRAISGGMDKTARVWDLDSGRQTAVLGPHAHMVRDVVAVPDGRHVLTGSYEEAVRVWDVSTLRCVRTLGDPQQGVSGGAALAATPDGRQAVTGGEDGTVRVWDAQTGACLYSLEGHVETVTAICVTPDGKHTITGSADSTCRVWRMSSGECQHTLRGHAGHITAVAVTADGQRAVSVGDDATLRVWSLVTGRQRACLRAGARVAAVAVGPGGLYCAGDDLGNVFFLRLENDSEGPPVCTAWRSPVDDSLAFGCLHCRAWPGVAARLLGTELPCPNCGRPIKLNEFVIEANWRPVAEAWPSLEVRYWLAVPKGKPKGPYPESKVRQGLRARRLPERVVVCKHGTQEWLTPEQAGLTDA